MPTEVVTCVYSNALFSLSLSLSLSPPKAYLWEWLWLLSLPFTYLGLSACRRSNASSMTKFMSGVLLFGILPVTVGLGIHFPDVYTYATAGKKAAAAEDMTTWKVTEGALVASL